MTIGGGVTGSSSNEVVRPLWSLALGLGPGFGIRPGVRGGWLVSTRATLALFAPNGGRRWEVDAVGEAQPPVSAQDGSLLRIEGDLVVGRDPESGQIVQSFPAPRAAWLTVDPWGGLLYSEANPDGVAMLHCTTMTGEQRWSRPLGGRAHLAFPPLLMADTAVVHCGGLLRALGGTGEVRWSAGHGGFRDPGRGADVMATEDADEMWAFPLVFDPTRLLVGLSWRTGRGLFAVDVASCTVEPYADRLIPQAPISVVPGPDTGCRVAMQGPSYEIRQMDWRWSVVMLDSAGSQLWEHRLHAPPLRLVPGANHTLIVSGTPSRQRWNDYHRWQDLSKDIYVRCLGADGTERWTWYGPGPLSNHPLVGPDGVVYVGSEGRLWALPPGQ